MTDDAEDTQLRKRVTPPYWWPDATTILQLFMAVSGVGMVWFVLYYLMNPNFKLDPNTEKILLVILGIILGNYKDVSGFVWGSSVGSKSKDDAISRSMESKDKIIAEGVAASTASSTAATEVALRAVAPPAAPPVASQPIPMSGENDISRTVDEDIATANTDPKPPTKT